MKSIADNIQLVRQRAENAQKKYNRTGRPVQLLAISKTKPASAIREAWHAGLTSFGENYVQEALIKMRELSDLDLCWHFTGPIQTNKTRHIAENFSWVHTIDRQKVAERLAAQRSESLPALNVCLQVNINAEAGKAGVSEHDVPALAKVIEGLPKLKLRGLMCLPDPHQSTSELHQTFARMRKLLQASARTLPAMDTLSMGMSRDLEIAIAEGATIIRVGTDIFGPRA